MSQLTMDRIRATLELRALEVDRPALSKAVEEVPTSAANEDPGLARQTCDHIERDRRKALLASTRPQDRAQLSHGRPFED